MVPSLPERPAVGGVGRRFGETAEAMRRIRSKAARWFKKSFRGAGRVNAFGMGTIRLIDVGSAGELPEPWFSRQ